MSLYEANPEYQIAHAVVEKPRNRLLIAFGSSFVFINPINIVVYIVCTAVLFFIIGFQGGMVFLYGLLIYFPIFIIGAYIVLSAFNKL